jgi:DNA repair protein RecO (recombination protein O)
MTRPRNYQTEAVIIKKTKLGEADRILTLYTPDLGKIQAVAKGVRRPRSKMAGHLELLTHSQVSLARGRNLDTVTGSQTIDGFLPLKGDLELTSCALYIAELTEQFTADHDENRPLFELLLKTMHRLCQDTDRELTLRYFELHLLDLTGYRPQLGRCTACSQALKPETNFFSPCAGGVLCPGCQPTQPAAHPLSLDALKVLRWLQDSEAEDFGRLKVSRPLSREMETLMRACLRYLLEGEVRSTAWRDTLREQAAPRQVAEEEGEG